MSQHDVSVIAGIIVRMSGATEAAASADSAVERVRDDPMGRLGLLRQMYRVPTTIDGGYLPYRRSATRASPRVSGPPHTSSSSSTQPREVGTARTTRASSQAIWPTCRWQPPNAA
ncbi:exported hypothetical protein [uncultured Mycobacterium sp.]|uniref:Uncharacterized protein n=1 Tax=uncultured Mycobacterium sp. TaxID=171292 RepID=A0A1Y5PIZ0_9MYCO|nr:exported hypothetical protein [uncultured Mycobacterium sp.]